LREEVEEREIDGVVGGGWKFRRREGGKQRVIMGFGFT
jgi:hypothetical protein